MGDARESVPAWLVLLVFSPFVVDATVTLLRRALQGEPVWRAHRSHFYQRLVSLGWGHRRTTLSEYLLMAGCALSALAVQSAGPKSQATAVIVWAIVYGILALLVTRLERVARQDGRQPNT